MAEYHTRNASAMSATQTPALTHDEIDCQIAALEGRICWLNRQETTPLIKRHIQILKNQKRALERKLEEMAVLVKTQPKSNGRIGGIEI